MISIETFEKLGRQYQVSVFPNIVREYFQHIFLGELYKLPNAEKLLFKGGTALRIVYGSPRFSEALDFSLFGVPQKEAKHFVEGLFVDVLSEIEHFGVRVELGEKIGATSGGYFGVATFHISEYPPVGVEINASSRNMADVRGETDSIANNFVPTYTVIHFPKTRLLKKKFLARFVNVKSRAIFMICILLCARGCSPRSRRKNWAQSETALFQTRNRLILKMSLVHFCQLTSKGLYGIFRLRLNAN